MPQVWSCDPEWFAKLKNEQPKVVVATWSEKAGMKNNEWLEKLQALESTGVPVFVCDGACAAILEKLGSKGDGETIVFENGVEKGRLTPSDNIEDDLNKVREMTK